MTLVVGAKDNDGRFAMCGDTRISHFAHGERPVEHRLKTIIIGTKVCIGYANSPEKAHAIINGFFKRIPDVRALSKHLLTQHLLSNNTVDFLVADGREDQLRFYKISDGKIDEGQPMHWIGDIQLFRNFQRLRQTRKAAPTGALFITTLGEDLVRKACFKRGSEYQGDGAFCAIYNRNNKHEDHFHFQTVCEMRVPEGFPDTSAPVDGDPKETYDEILHFDNSGNFEKAEYRKKDGTRNFIMNTVASPIISSSPVTL